MSSYKERLENTQARRTKERAVMKRNVNETVGGVLVGPVATAMLLDNIQLGPLTGRQLAGLAGVALTFTKFGKKPAGQIAGAAGRFAAGQEVYDRAKAIGNLQSLLGLGG